jgi:hypothetical protein
MVMLFFRIFFFFAILLTRRWISFRRPRFNWPSQLPKNHSRQSYDGVEELYSGIGHGKTAASRGRSPRKESPSSPITMTRKFEELTQVRTLRVFHAVKG